jgi:hypothetical protein
MAKHMYVILSNPVEGKEDEYNDWYSNRHLDDVMREGGFTAAQRFRLCDMNPAQPFSPQRYLAIYEIDTDDVEKVNAALTSAAGTAAMPISEALDFSSFAGGFFEAMTERLTSD